METLKIDLVIVECCISTGWSFSYEWGNIFAKVLVSSNPGYRTFQSIRLTPDLKQYNNIHHVFLGEKNTDVCDSGGAQMNTQQ